ncbi:MAG: GntR family transcriptional regulator [Syntrophales bacterium]
MELDKLIPTIEIPKQKPVVLIVYEQLSHAIVAGKLAEGERLLEADLAKLFGVSRQPIREALRMLVTDGFVELIPYRGVIVSTITPREAKDTLELKGMVEGYAAWMGAQMFSPEMIAELETLIRRMETHIREAESREIIQDNYNFHMQIVSGIGNEKLIKYYQGLFNSHQRYYAIGLSERPGWQTSVNEHRLILEKIISRDTVGAFTCARQHASNTIDRVLAALEKRGKEADGSPAVNGRPSDEETRLRKTVVRKSKDQKENGNEVQI